MTNYLKNLTDSERKTLVMAPVYAAIRGALEDGTIHHRQEKESTHLAHLRTFTSAPILQDYYKKVERSFENDFQLLKNSLPKDIDDSKGMINVELEKVKQIMLKLDSDFAKELSNSLQSFSKHVAGTKSILEDWVHYFVVPLNIEKGSD